MAATYLGSQTCRLFHLACIYPVYSIHMATVPLHSSTWQPKNT